jgi:hypothetical protein
MLRVGGIGVGWRVGRALGVWVMTVAIRRRSNGRGRPCVAEMRRILRGIAGVLRRVLVVRRLEVRKVVVRWVAGLHRRPRQGRHRRFVEARLGVHALSRSDMSERDISAGLQQVDVASRVVCNQVEMLSRRGGDAEGLLHEPVGFVSIAIRFSVILVLVASAARVRSLPRASPTPAAKGVPPLAFHLPVSQEAPRHTAGAP